MPHPLGEETIFHTYTKQAANATILTIREFNTVEKKYPRYIIGFLTGDTSKSLREP